MRASADLDLDVALADAFAAIRPREALFVRAYATGRNGIEAAVAAGYAPSGAKARASRLLQKDRVKRALQLLKEQSAQEAKHDLVRYMRALEDGCEFARQNKSAVGLMQGLRMIGEASGHINNKVEVNIAPVIDVRAARAQFDAAAARAIAASKAAETVEFVEHGRECTALPHNPV